MLQEFLIRHVGSKPSTRGIPEAILNLEQEVGFEPLTKDSRSSPSNQLSYYGDMKEWSTRINGRELYVQPFK
jgi:hypothetical protein